MSRLGKRSIPIPQGVEVSTDNGNVCVKGPKGELKTDIGYGYSIEKTDNGVLVNRPESGVNRQYQGLYRGLIINMIEGVSNGFTRQLELVGVGYRVQKKGNDLEFSLGYSHPILIKAPEGIQFDTEGQNKCKISGNDKQKVGQVTAKIRSLRKKDPYKGKGIFFPGEVFRRKAGKSVK